jgi:hypothetical protein
LYLAGLCALICALGTPLWAGPLLSRNEIMTVDELRPGMKGISKSVFSGTKVESFRVTVLGVLRKVDFDGDIILVRIDSGPVVTKRYGVVAGMSGSPVYVGGKLIGAIAFAWSFSKEPIAGVTPITQMLEDFQPGSSPVPPRKSKATSLPADRVALGGRVYRQVAVSRGDELGLAPDGETALLRPISTPLMVSGLGPAGIRRLRQRLGRYGIMPVAAPSGDSEPVKTPLQPGAVIGVQLVGGDIQVTALGTLTCVKGNRALAFGHDLSGLGSAEMPLVRGRVLAVIPGLDISVKMAASAQVVGKMTEDRPWCIGGVLGDKRIPLVDSSFTVSDRDRRVTRHYRAQVIRHRELTGGLLSELVWTAIERVGPLSEGTTRLSFELEAEGLPPVRRENTYVSGGEGLTLSLFSLLGLRLPGYPTDELDSLLDQLENNPFGPAPPNRLSVEVSLGKQRELALIRRVSSHQRRVRPGEEVEVAVALQPLGAAETVRHLKVKIPEAIPAGQIRIGVAGGRSEEMMRSRLGLAEPSPKNLGQMVAQLLDRARNTDLVVEAVWQTGGMEAEGKELPSLPASVAEVLLSANATRLRPLRDHQRRVVPLPWVVSGAQVLTLQVEPEEPAKVRPGAPARPSEAPASTIEDETDLLRGLFGGMEAAWQERKRPGIEFGTGDVEPDESESVDLESPPPMPSWEEVAKAGEEEEAPSPPAPSQPAAKKREGLGRQPSVWRQTVLKDFADGKSENTAITSEGELILTPASQKLPAIPARLAWALAVDAAAGDCYLGSWLPGEVYSLRDGEAPKLIFRSGEPAVTALLSCGPGFLLAATAPGGVIQRVSLLTGRGEQFFATGETYVWALAQDGRGNIWAATGPNGKVFRISLEGKGELAAALPDQHVIALAVGPAGQVFAATYPKGKVYRLDGGVRSVFEVPKAAAQSLAVDLEGNLYVGTSPEPLVYRITPQGSMEELFKAQGERHIFSLLPIASGKLLVGSGPAGNVYLVEADGKSSLIYESRAYHLVSLARTGQAAFAAFAPAGQVVRFSLDTAEGLYLSPIHDAGGRARWGSIRWRQRAQAPAKLSLETRSGNTAFPDATWSNWEPVKGDGDQSEVASPSARYLQYRVKLAGPPLDPPGLSQFELFYLPPNRRPQVKVLAPKAGDVWSGKQSVRWSAKDPDNDQLTSKVFYSADDGKGWTEIIEEKPKEKAEAQAEPEKVKGKRPSKAGTSAPPKKAPAPAPPSAPSGENGAEEGRAKAGSPLVQADAPAEVKQMLEDRAPSAPDGKTPPQEAGAEAKAEKEEAKPEKPAPTSLSWDTKQVKDGRYLVKVAVSDRRANPAEPLSEEQVSVSFLVDNTPPEILTEKAGEKTGPPPASIAVEDKTSYVAGGEWRVDEGEWAAAVAKDRLFDSGRETIEFDPAWLPGGKHKLELRVRDAAGNEATAQVEYVL